MLSQSQRDVSHYLDQALAAAQSRLGFTAPNPAVGAVIVIDDQIIATGAHQQAGSPHAEVMAIRAAGDADLSQASIVVSLQPCCHYGKTPPCTSAIINAGIKRVVYAHRDLNPEVAQRSDQILRDAGVSVEFVDYPQARHFYRAYDFWRQTGRPYVTAKLAISRDGCYKSVDGAPVAITGPECRRFTHQQRLHVDAIMTTVETVLADDPQLNVRLDEQAIAKPVIVLDRQCRMPLGAKLWQTARQLILVCDEQVDDCRQQRLQQRGANIIALPCNNDHLDWQLLMTELAQQGLHHVWVEAGATLYRYLWQQSLLQQAILYVGDCVLGEHRTSAGLNAVVSLNELASMSVKAAGDDLILDSILS